MSNEIINHIKNKSKVISLEHGIGEIVANFSMYDGVDDYLEVFYFTDKKPRYFCVKHTSDIRLLSSKENIELALREMKSRVSDHSIINKFNELNTEFIEKNVLFIVKRVVDLIRKNELNSSDNLLLQSSINSLIQEIEEVYKVDNQDAREMVEDCLKAA